jgi:glycosyltransferase involved in cell wall biosynthesis
MIPRNDEFDTLVKLEERKVGGYLHDILLTDNFDILPELVSACKIFSNSEYLISSHPYFFKMFDRFSLSGKRIYEAHNVDYELKKTYFDWQHNVHARKYLEMVKDIEKMACDKADLVMVVSRDDGNKLSEIYDFKKEKLVLVPNGIDLSVSKFYPIENRILSSKGRKKAVFVGSIHGPNVEAVEFIINDLAPKNSSVDFIIIGNINMAFNDKCYPGNVIFTGLLTEEEKSDIYRKASLAINPMFSGSGSNLKIPEYAAAGIPIVSTRFGMRGFELLEEFVFLSECDEFSDVIERFFMSEIDNLKYRINEARRICEKFYSKDAIVDGFLKKELKNKKEAR